MALDILGYRDKWKKFYGDKPLEDVAKDAYMRGGYDKQYPDFDTWKKESGIDADILADNEKRNPIKTAPLRLVKSFVEGGARGLTTELPSMVGGTIEFAGSHLPGKAIEETGKTIKDWADEKATEWYGPEKERTGLDRIVYEGTKMLAPSIVPGGIVLKGARAAKGIDALLKAGKIAEATKAASAASNVASGSVAGLFGLSQAQQTRDTANQQATELEAQGDYEGARKAREAGQGIAPIAAGAIEAAGEFLGTKYLGKLFGLDEAAIAKRGTKEFAKDLLKTLGVEVGTEIGQASGESAVEKYSGIRPDAEPLQEAIDVIGPTAFMTLLTGGLAGAANRLHSKDPQEREGAEALEKQKQGALLSMTIYEGLKTGQLDGKPFTNDDALQIMRDGRKKGMFSQEDIDRFHEYYPGLKKEITQEFYPDIYAKEQTKNNYISMIDTGIMTGKYDNTPIERGDIVAIASEGYKQGLFTPSDIDDFSKKYPGMRADFQELYINTVIDKVNAEVLKPAENLSDVPDSIGIPPEGGVDINGTLQTETEIANVAPTADLTAQDSIKGTEAAAGAQSDVPDAYIRAGSEEWKNLPPGEQRDNALTKRAEAAKELVSSLKAGDVITYPDGNKLTIQSIDKTNTILTHDDGTEVFQPTKDFPAEFIPSRNDGARATVTRAETTNPPANVTGEKIVEHRGTVAKQIYRGSGRDSKGGAYNDLGDGEALLSDGQFWALNEKDAKRYGPKVEAQPMPEFSKPLVVKDDYDWQALIKKAVGKYDSADERISYPNPTGLPKEKMDLWRKGVSDYLKESGHDALIINMDGARGDDAKTLGNTFGHSQIFIPSASKLPAPLGEAKSGESSATFSKGDKVIVTYKGQKYSATVYDSGDENTAVYFDAVDKPSDVHPDMPTITLDNSYIERTPSVTAAKARPVRKEKVAQNMVTEIANMGGIKFTPDYNTKWLKEDPDLKRVLNNKSGQPPDAVANTLIAKGYPIESSDHMIELLKTGEGRKIYNPELADKLINRDITRAENEWITEQLINLKEEGIDAGAISESEEDLTEVSISEIAAEEELSESEIAFAERDAADFFAAVAEKPKGDVQPNLAGLSPEQTFELSNGTTEWSKPLPKQPKQKNNDLFGADETQSDPIDLIDGEIADRALELAGPHLNKSNSESDMIAALEEATGKAFDEVIEKVTGRGITEDENSYIKTFNKHPFALNLYGYAKRNGLIKEAAQDAAQTIDKVTEAVEALKTFRETDLLTDRDKFLKLHKQLSPDEKKQFNIQRKEAPKASEIADTSKAMGDDVKLSKDQKTGKVLPQDGWEDHIIKARVYALNLGIQGKVKDWGSLESIVKAIKEHLEGTEQKAKVVGDALTGDEFDAIAAQAMAEVEGEKASTGDLPPGTSQREMAAIRAQIKQLKTLGADTTGYDEWVKIAESGDVSAISKEPGARDTLKAINLSIAEQKRRLKDEAPAAAETQTEGKAFKVGDRVVLKNGRHGEIVSDDSYTMSSYVFGTGKSSETRTIRFGIKSDAGAIYKMYDPTELTAEIDKPGTVVPDVLSPITNEYEEPDRVLYQISLYRRDERKHRAAAQRARKKENINEQLKLADGSKSRGDKMQAVFDEWAAKYPEEAKKNQPEPASAPAAKAATGQDLNSFNLRVTKSQTKTGKTAWEVSGNTREHAAMLKAAGGRWYGPKKVWSFYNSDPTSDILSRLGVAPKPAEAPFFKETGVDMKDGKLVPHEHKPSLTNAAAEAGKGIDATYDALAALFKAKAKETRGTMSGLDSDLYAAVKPLFAEAYQHFKAAGREVKDWIVEVISQLKARGISPAESMPYVKYFYMNDMKTLTNSEEGDTLNLTGGIDNAQNDTRTKPVQQPNVDGTSGLDAGQLPTKNAGPVPGKGTQEVSGSQDGAGNGEANTVAGEGTKRRPGGRSSQGVDNLPEQRPGTDGRGSDGADTAAAGADTGVGGAGLSGQRGANNRIAPDDVLFHSGKVARINANIKAITLLKKLEAKNRPATAEEKKILQQFSGWGAVTEDVFKDKFTDYLELRAKNPDTYRYTEPSHYFYNSSDLEKYNEWEEKYGKKLHPLLGGMLTEDEWRMAADSGLNAHYTSPEIINAMWKMAEHLGVNKGRVLEPAAGVGHFLGLMPDNLIGKVKLAGIELDPITGGILKALYPEAKIQVSGFEKAKLQDNFYDMVISNFPFGDYPIHDADHEAYNNWHIHNYFFARALDAVRPGGIVMAVTSRYTMDSTKNGKVREYLANKADFIGAIRLPGTAFAKNAGTSVTTDIIILQKKTGTAYPSATNWRTVLPVKTKEGDSFNVNEYFTAHPEMVLGEHSSTGSMYGGGKEYTLTPPKAGTMQEHLDWVTDTLPRDIVAGESANETVEEKEVADQNAKDGTFVIQGGKLGLVKGGLIDPVSFADNAAKVKRAKEYVGIKETYKKLIDAMNNETATDEEIAEIQATMNSLYDKFVSKNGHFHDRSNKYLNEDDEYVLALSLEDVKHRPAKKGGIDIVEPYYEKGDAFSKRTVYPFREPKSADNIEDAANLSITYRNAVDLPFIAHLLRIDQDAAKTQLLDKALAYENPSSGLLETPTEYLSGNVRRKLHAAEGAGEKYKNNVEALQKVQPPDKVIDEIPTRLGDEWVPADIIKGFARSLVPDNNLNVTMSSVQAGGESAMVHWKVQPMGYVNENSPAYVTWGAERNNLYELMEDSLNLKRTSVFDWVPDEHGTGGKEVFNLEKSLVARQKQKEIQEAFRSYILDHNEVGVALAKIFNTEKNNYVIRQYEAPKLDHYPGATNLITLREHQKRAVARGMTDSTIFAHAVGTGKTYLYTTLGMELRRIKAARKPMIVVQGSTIKQFASSARKLYPTAKILALTKDLTNGTENRRSSLAKIASGDWDLVIIPHSTFNLIGSNPDREAGFIQEQLDEIRDAIREEGGADADSSKAKRNDSMTVKQLRKMLKRKEARLESLRDKPHEDKAIYFEDLGVDALLIDEAHTYKRGDFFTKMDNIKGLDRSASQKSFDFLMKVRYVQEKTNGKNIYLATGTPITNTLAEIWTIMRYTRPELLREYGVEHFDGFASLFTEAVAEIEPTETGEFKQVERLKKYRNGFEMMNMWLTAADVILQEDVPGWADMVPALKNGEHTNVTLDRSEELGQLIESIKIRRKNWDDLTGKEKRNQSHVPLVLYGEAKKAAIDLRLVHPENPDTKDSKVNACVKEAYSRYKASDAIRGTQLIFCDIYQSPDPAAKKVRKDDHGVVVSRELANPHLVGVPRFNLYADIKNKLIEKGIPENEIAIINDKKYDKDEAKERLFELVNDGSVRIVLGSTEKLGTGVNAQERMVAIHNIDAPARPMDLEQRIGRLIRPGNINKMADVVNYVTVNSLDNSAFMRLRDKMKFVNQVLRGMIAGSNFDDPTSELQATFEDLVAVASNNPLVQKRFALENQIRELNALSEGWNRKQGQLREGIVKAQSRNDYHKIAIPYAEKEAAFLKEKFPPAEARIITSASGAALPETALQDTVAAVHKEMTDAYNKIVVEARAAAKSAPSVKTAKGTETGFNAASYLVKFRELSQTKEFKINGVKLELRFDIDTKYTKVEDWDDPDFTIRATLDRGMYDFVDGFGNVRKMEGSRASTGTYKTVKGMLDNLEANITREIESPESHRSQVSENNKNIASLEEELAKPFKYSEKLKELRAELKDVYAQMETKPKDENTSEQEVINDQLIDTRDDPEQYMVDAWHGSPHTFDKFSGDRIGSGEGNQAYGYGLYFAGAKEVAEYYKDYVYDKFYFRDVNRRLSQLDKQMQEFRSPGGDGKFTDIMGYELKAEYDKLLNEKLEKKGHLYQVELAPDDDEFLLWDKPFDEQSDKVKAALSKADYEEGSPETGEQIYAQLMMMAGHGLGWAKDPSIRDKRADQAASEYLHSLGIRGIQYVNGDSRDGMSQIQASIDRALEQYQYAIKTGNTEAAERWDKTYDELKANLEGAYNYVIFSDKDVEIKERYALRNNAARTMPTLADVQEIFKGQKVTQSSNGLFLIETRGGRYAVIESVESITPDSASLKVGYGSDKLKDGDFIAGSYRKGTIKLAKGKSDKWTLAHESTHFMEDMGIIDKLDIATLRGHIKRLVRDGQFKTMNKEDIGGKEDRANFIANALLNPPKGAIGRIIERIQDFIDKIVKAFGIRTARGVVKDVKSGEIFNQKPDGKFILGAEDLYQYSINEDHNKEWWIGRDIQGEIDALPKKYFQGATRRLLDEGYVPITRDEADALYEQRLDEFIAWAQIKGVQTTGDEGLFMRPLRFQGYESRRYKDGFTEANTKARELYFKYRERYHAYIQGGAGEINRQPGRGASPIREEGSKQAELGMAAEPAEQYSSRSAQNTPAFKKWFGDSKVVDKNGDPLVVYHGTDAEFDAFDDTATVSMGHHFGTESQAMERSDNPPKSFYLSIKNPLRTPDVGWSDPDLIIKRFGEEGVLTPSQARELKSRVGDWNDITTAFRSIQKYLAEKFGADGIVYQNKFEGNGEDSYIAFDPTQIKSVNNRGTFDAGNPDINYSVRSPQDPPTSRDPKVLNLYLKDEADALVKTMMHKLHPKSMTWLETMLKSPEWFGHPAVKKIVSLFVRDRNELYHETFNHLNLADDIDAPENTVTEAGNALKGKGLSIAGRIAGKESAEYKMLGRFIDHFDTSWKKDKNKTLAENMKACEDYMKKNGATDDVIKVWRLYRTSYDKALVLLTRQMEELISRLKEQANFRGEEANVAELQQTLRYALSEMKQWEGFYAPRLREAGDWAVRAYKEHGPLPENREYYREHRGSELSAQRLAKKLAREGWQIASIGRVQKLPETVYQDVKAASTAKLIESALSKFTGKENALLQFNSDILQTVADEIRARGFRSSMIHRKEGEVIRGYIEDPIKRHLLYINNMSGGVSKAQVARMAMEELLGQQVMGKQVGGIDPVKDPEAYKTATNYIEEQLRNLDNSDRIIGLAKSIATFKFLGFNIRSLAVNMTALVTTAPAAIHQYAMGGKGSFAAIFRELGVAGKDFGGYMAGRKLKNMEEQAFLDEMRRKGWDDPQYTRDALGTISKTHSRVWATAMNTSMYLFGKSEQFNRGATILAAYRLARKQGLSVGDAKERAKDATDKAHGVYGKATMPMWAQGTNPAAKIGQMLYVYGKFSHNYLQMLYDMGLKKHNIKGAMFAFLSPLVVAGGAALPFKGAIFGLAGAILSAFGWDDDPEKWVWDQIREHLGAGAETVARHGLTGAAGVDISGSLSIGVGIPKNIMDLSGAIGGSLETFATAFDAARTGSVSKAIEAALPTGLANPIKAYRESQEGISTKRNYPVWDESGKQLTPTAGESAEKFFGFRSARQAVLSERTWEGKQQQTDYQEKRNALYQRYRSFILSGSKDRKTYMKFVVDVREYNKKVREAGLINMVPLITSESLKAQMRRMDHPAKRERAILEQ